MGDEIDGVEYEEQMLINLKENKNRGMKRNCKRNMYRPPSSSSSVRATRTSAEIDDYEFKKDKSKGMKQGDMSQNITTLLSDFPESIVFDFLVRIPPRYIYKNFMTVCKSWKEMFSERSFAELNFAKSKRELLLIQAASTGKHMKTKLIEIGKELEPEIRDLGINRLGQVRTSCQGFLLISKPRDINNGELQVINPTTKFFLTIPKCPSGCAHKSCSIALGFDSTMKQYKIVHVVTDSYGFEIFNLSNGNERWERVPGPWENLNDRPFYPPDFYWKNPVSINGRILHWYVDTNEYFISMEVTKEVKFVRTYFPRLSFGEVILIELGGFLSFVHRDSDMKMNIWILEDIQGQVWSKKYSIVAESINYICPKNVNSSSQYERSMPDLGKLVAVAGVRNGEVLILKHKNSSIYVYDMRTGLMKKANIKMKNLETFIPYKDSLFSMK